MIARTRDFIYTKDDLFFATTSYLHPKDRILSFLRYIPDENGDRSKNGKKYSKVDSKQAYEFLKKEFPDYLFDCENTKVMMMGVPHEDLEKIIKPEKRLNEIMNSETEEELLKKVVKIADTFHEYGNISYKDMGISGSILPGLYDAEKSDIDFVIYGLENHRKALHVFEELKDKIIFNSISDEYWERLYDKRIKDSTLSIEEFKWYEKRKNNRGIIEGTLFDILATRKWEEIRGKYGEVRYEPVGISKINCTVSDSLGAFDNPAVYKVENVEIKEGLDVNITEIASFTHTYAGQARDGEEIVARGKLEKVIDNDQHYRLVVGTTREAINEYVKLRKLFK
ncbi:MAG: DNA polymerase subunit beta [Methanobacteriaceae archaeon]|nr:DNA polymerase subunit beta [Methanobacteriaceae archaeon]